MSKWLLGNQALKSVLEPAFGLGIFSRELITQKPDLDVKGFDIDPTIFNDASNYFGSFPNVKLSLGDYMYNDWSKKYDGIICNPPYFKFHDYDNKQILKEVEDKLNFKFNGFTNLYTLFLLKSIYQLKKNGRAAYIIPSEFLNSDYGKLVKQYLVQSNTLRHLFIIDFKKNVFEGALTTASILLLAKDDNTKEINFSTIHSKHDLSKIMKYIEDYPNIKGEYSYGSDILNTKIKWRKYYNKQNSELYKNLVPFSNYAKVVRGIATGANQYFTFNKSKAKKFSISEKNLLPCICKAKDVKGFIFTKEKFEQLSENDELIYLFDAIKSTDENVKKYIEKGESEKINERFLTKSRNPWYLLENRPPAPIWVSVFNRNGLKFIRNESNISNLTTFHCVYPAQSNLFTSIDIDLLFAYLLTDTAKEIFNDNRREYGNGLKKFEPNDLNKAQIIDIELLPNSSKEKILILYRSYKKTDNISFIKEIDKIIKSYFLI